MFGKIQSEEERFEEDVQEIYSKIITPIKEVKEDQILNIVKKRCIENNVQIISTIYGFENGCPVCLNDYTKDTWTVLHPCGHLLCDVCLKKINNIAKVQHLSRKCPICRVTAKWISENSHNLNKTTEHNLPFNFGSVSQNNTISYFGSAHSSFNNSLSAIEPVLIPCKPPIEENKTETIEPKIECHISKQIFEIDGINKIFGNISIIADELISKDSSGIDLLIVFDVSGSMNRVAREGVSILKYVVDCLDSKDRLSIITFDNNSKQLFGLQPMVTSVKNTCKEVIDKCYTGGSTNLESAINLMIKVKEDGMTNTRPFKIIVLSDGNPDYGKEGKHLIPKLYEGDIKPEIYSCTFGDNVRADVMKHFLTEQNILNYNHIENMNQFKSLTAEIGLDKNIIVGKNIIVKISKMEVLTNLNIVTKENGLLEIIFEQIKTSDIFTLPFIIDGNEEPFIQVIYTSNSGECVVLENQNVENIDNFVKNNYWYKRIGQNIKDIMSNSNKENKLKELNKLLSYVTVENLGDFYNEITNLINETKLTINNENNNSYYNTCTSSAQKTYSHASKTSNMVYKSKFSTSKK